MLCRPPPPQVAELQELQNLASKLGPERLSAEQRARLSELGIASANAASAAAGSSAPSGGGGGERESGGHAGEVEGAEKENFDEINAELDDLLSRTEKLASSEDHDTSEISG